MVVSVFVVVAAIVVFVDCNPNLLLLLFNSNVWCSIPHPTWKYPIHHGAISTNNGLLLVQIVVVVVFVIIVDVIDVAGSADGKLHPILSV